MIRREDFTSQPSGLPPLPPSVFDDREGCPICSGPPGTCIRHGEQDEHLGKAAWIKAFAEERSKLQVRGRRKVPGEGLHDEQ